MAGAGVNGLALVVAVSWALIAAGLSARVDNSGNGNQFAENPKGNAFSEQEEAKGPKKDDPVIAEKGADKEPKTDPPVVKNEPGNTEKKSELLDSKEAEAFFKMAKAAQERAEAAEKRATELLAKAEELETKNDLDRRKLAEDTAKAEKEIAEKKQELGALSREIEAAKPKDIAKTEKTDPPTLKKQALRGF